MPIRHAIWQVAAQPKPLAEASLCPRQVRYQAALRPDIQGPAEAGHHVSCYFTRRRKPDATCGHHGPAKDGHYRSHGRPEGLRYTSGCFSACSAVSALIVVVRRSLGKSRWLDYVAAAGIRAAPTGASASRPRRSPICCRHIA
jgi:hypothetical protein